MNQPNANHFQKPDIENSLIASLIIDPDELFKHEISHEIFTEKRALFFSALKKLIESGVKPDLVTLKNELDESITIQDLMKIVDSPVSPNPDYHIKQLQTARKRRDLYQALNQAREMCLNGSGLSEIDSKVKSGIANIESHEPKKNVNILANVLEEIEKESTGEYDPGIKTGISTLDYYTNGFQGGDIITIAARPGQGKTSLVLNMARNFAYNNIPGMIFSLEMKCELLMRRMICDVGSIDGKYLFQGQLKKERYVWDYIVEASQKIHEFPIVWDDSSGLTIDKICSRTRKQKALYGIKYACVDYVQLIWGWNENGQGPKAEIYSQFKSLANELDIFIIILSQMNREIEKRQQKKPQMSDLRDAGCIEQDSTHIIFPVIENKMSGRASTTYGDQYEPAILYLEKNRNGRTGPIKTAKWQGHYYRYSDQNVDNDW